MSEIGQDSFQGAAGDIYDRFMGRYSRKLSPILADQADVRLPMRVLDVGCGPGELTEELVRRVGADAVSACDPSSSFVEACRTNNPGVHVDVGTMESLPFDDNAFDASLAQLVLHFVGDPAQGMREMIRVTKPGGVIGASGWDMERGMEMLMVFSTAATSIVPRETLDKFQFPFTDPGSISTLFASAGLTYIDEQEVTVSASYSGFEEFWESLRNAPGPIEMILSGRSEADIATFRDACAAAVNHPSGAFSLTGRAFSVIGRVPK